MILGASNLLCDQGHIFRASLLEAPVGTGRIKYSHRQATLRMPRDNLETLPMRQRACFVYLNLYDT